MPSDDEIHRLHSEVSGEEEIEATFRRLRQEGRSRLEAMQLILDALDVSLAEAKTLLLTTDTWEEARRAAPGSGPNQGDDGASGDDPVPPAPG